jgi:predicted transcriptional regulator of viral defense system
VTEAVDLLPDVFTYSQARGLGLTDRQVYALRDRGEIELLSRGLYRRTDFTGDPDLLEVAARAPEATLCLGTALARHDLTDEIPARIDVALPRTRRQPEVAAPIRWHRFEPDTFDVGRRVIDVGGLTMGLYSAERSICDAFRLRHLEGSEQAIEALKRWLRRGGSQPSALLRVAKRFGPRAEAPIREALEILL